MSSERTCHPTTSSAIRVSESERTYIGVDVGQTTLATLAPAGSPSDAVEVGGEGKLIGYWRHLTKTTRLLEKTPGVATNAEAAVLASEWRRIRSHLLDVVDDALDVVERYPHPILVREEFGNSPSAAWCHRHSQELGTWLLPTLIDALDREAETRGVTVVGVDPEYSSRVCHRCLERGQLGRDRFECENETCDVGTIDRDVNAAVVLADRARYGHRRRVHKVNR